MEEYFKAIKQGDLQTVQRITESHGDFIINEWRHGSGDTPLSEAAYYGHFPIVEYLVEHGATVNQEPDSAGNTILHVAAVPIADNPSTRGLVKDPKEALKIIIYLAKNGAEFDVLNVANGYSVLDYINGELFYGTEYHVNNLDEIKSLYRQFLFKPWKRSVRKAKKNNRIINDSRVVVRNIQLPDGSRLPHNVSEKIARLTAFGKKNSVLNDIKYLNSL